MSTDQRKDSFLVKMNELNLDFIVAYSDGMHSFLVPNFVFLLTGFKSIGESMLILQRNGHSTLISTPIWDASRAEQKSTASDTFTTDDLMKKLEEFVQTHEMTSDNVGFIGLKNIRQSSYSNLLSCFDHRLNHVEAHFLELTSNKSEQELEKANKATWIAERGYEKMLEVARPGIYEYELAAEIEGFMKSLGADDNFLLLSASQHNLAVRPPGRRRLEKGDIILAEISPSSEGQFTQICRSVVLGDWNQEYDLLSEKYNLLVHAMEMGVLSAVPGERMSNVVRAINEPLKKEGYGKYCGPPYMRVRGHGLGLSSLLPGDVSSDNDLILKEGMFFVIHPNQYIPETGYLLCGEPVAISSDGAKVLTKRRPALDIIAG